MLTNIIIQLSINLKGLLITLQIYNINNNKKKKYKLLRTETIATVSVK